MRQYVVSADGVKVIIKARSHRAAAEEFCFELGQLVHKSCRVKLAANDEEFKYFLMEE